MSKRGNGEGSIYRRADTGSWTAAITAQTPNGRRRRWITGASRAEVAAKLAALTVARGRGTLVIERPTVAQFLERWLASGERRSRTREVYAGYCQREILPALGHLRLDELGVPHVTAMMQSMADRGLGGQTIAHARGVLRAALSQAMREELVFRNVASIAKPPVRVEQWESRFLTLEEARRFLAAADRDRLAALYRVVLPLGLRTGEALALQWVDVDLEARTLMVRHTLQRVTRADRTARRGDGLVLQPTKTRRSRQKLPIPEVCVRALRRHRTAQLEERFAAGRRWHETGFIFTTPIGTPLDASNVIDQSFHPICERAGIPYATRDNMHGPLEERGLRLYDLRHSCASLLIAAGVPLRVVQDVLRHTNIRTTADKYTHLVPQVVAEALNAMDRAFLEVEAT